MNNLSSYCGLVDAKIRVSDKDLPVQAMQHAVEQQALNADPLDRQISSRWNPVLAVGQRESARLILKEDLGGTAYTIRKVRPLF